MPGRPRKDVIREDVVGVYHVWSRCAQGGWLFGVDPDTGVDYSHRKDWILERLATLTRVFAIDACVFAVLSSHYHLLVRNRVDLAAAWSDEEVVRRWWYLCPERSDPETGEPAEPTKAELDSLRADPARVAEWRKRLSSISWFMKFMNETIAKRANRESNKTGHFFQDRFGCRNLMDEGAVLACAIYIDLNEIRAQIAATPEESTYTSAYRRILAKLARERRAADGQAVAEPAGSEAGAAPGSAPAAAPDESIAAAVGVALDEILCPIHERECAPLLGPPGVASVAESRAALASSAAAPLNLGQAQKQWRHGFLPVGLDEYLQLLDWTGNRIAAGKSGAIEGDLPPILERLHLSPGPWVKLIENFERLAHGAVGSPARMAEEAARTGRQWLQGIRHFRLAYG